MKNEHKKEGLFLDFLKQLHLWGYSIADKSILSITEMRTRPSSILFTLRHSLQLQECLCTILVDPLMKKYTEWKTYQNIRDLRGFFKGSWRASKPLTLAKYVFNVSDTIWEPTFWQRTWKKNEASVGYAITIRSKLWRHRQSSSISSHRYLSF